MSDIVIVALITGAYTLTATVINVTAIVVSRWMSSKENAATVAKVDEIHRATNGMKAELVEEVRAASFARGVKSETDKSA